MFGKKPPILIYTMGKVGTDTIVQALEKAGHAVYKIHDLDKSCIERNLRTNPTQPDKDAKKFLDKVLPNLGHIKTITLIREVVGRNISGFFQRLRHFDVKPPYDKYPASDLIPIFLNHFNHSRPDNWIKWNFCNTLGIDLNSLPFDPNKGYSEFSKLPFEFLLMQAEIPDRQMEQLIGEFTGSEISLKRANRSKDKPYGELYSRFKIAFPYTDEYLDAALGSEVMKKFYSIEQRQHIKDFYQNKKDKLVPLPR